MCSLCAAPHFPLRPPPAQARLEASAAAQDNTAGMAVLRTQLESAQLQLATQQALHESLSRDSAQTAARLREEAEPREALALVARSAIVCDGHRIALEVIDPILKVP